MGTVASSLKQNFRLLVWQRRFLFVLDNFRKENLEATDFRSISPKEMGSETATVGSVSFKDGSCQSDTDNSNSHKQEPDASSPISKNNKAGDRAAAALQVQKVYRSYRTRRNLADCAVVAEELWWQAIDFITLKRNTVSFFDIGKPETAVSRWSRAGLKAAKVGKGLSKDENARKLAFQHWMEAIDPRHRYGHNLHFYYDAWFESDTVQPFFYWLDVGDGRSLDLEVCPRSKLQKQRIKYLGPKEREHYEFVPQNGKLVYKQSGELVDTTNCSEGSKWIFVMSTSKRLFVGQKRKGTFQHSSFLAGGATSAAGRFVVENGILKAIWPHSGHYLPTEQNIAELFSFLEENGIDLSNVEKGTYEAFSQEFEKEDSKHNANDDGNTQREADIARNIENEFKNNGTDDRDHEANRSEDKSGNTYILSQLGNEPMIELQMGTETVQSGEEKEKQEPVSYKRNLPEELTIEKPEVPHMQLLQRLNSKKSIQSYQLGKQLSLKWSSGVGPRIGCVADYPAELRAFALERVNLSPRCTSPSNYQLPNCVTPKPPKLVTPSSNRSPGGKPPLIVPSPKFKSPLMIPSPISKSPLNPCGDGSLNTPTKPISTAFS